MSELVTLRCPNCGAPIQPGQVACDFCGSALYVGQAAEVALPAVADASKIAGQMRERIDANAFDGDAYYQLGLALFTLRLYDQAEESFRQAERLLPGSALPPYFLALAILHSSGEEVLSIPEFRLRQSAGEFRTAYKIDPRLGAVKAYLLLIDGLLARDKGNYEAALKPLHDAVAERPSLDLGWIALAACYFQLGRYEDAIRAGLKASKLRPDDDSQLYLVGAAYERLDQEEQAEHYARVVAERRGDPASWERILNEYKGVFA